MTFQRVIQSLSLGIFLLALWRAPHALLGAWPADGSLRMDPMILLGTVVAGRKLAPFLWITGCILLLCMLLGRFFCAYLCPLGATIDGCDHFLRRQHDRSSPSPSLSCTGLRHLKYQLLIFILGAGILGVSFVFVAAPMALATRLYGLIIYPGLYFLADLGLTTLRPAADQLNLTAIAYAVVKAPRYDLQWLTFSMSLALLAGGVWTPRFWCRNLCPSGALLALFSRRPIVRRTVSQDCSNCGLCARKCPMGAIGMETEDAKSINPFRVNHAECIVCLTCVRVCPTHAVSFRAGKQSGIEKIGRQTPTISLDRRRVLGAGVSGSVAAILTLTGLKAPSSAAGPGNPVHPAVIRPPGAIPEKNFLARCVRCDACMQACPTNTLQPLGWQAGLSALYSPVVKPRRGPCAPDCTACGDVCPTGSLRPLHPEEKLKAKVGTARIFRQKCLAWEFDKKCLICDEVCPFDAIEFRKLPDMHIAVPFVNEKKCFGCGYCEYHCPVQAVPAIVVEPMQALRLSGGSYRTAAREMGYTLETKPKAGTSTDDIGPQDLPLFQLDEKGLPPGFTE